ncbi:SHOCT domain-containing protein [Candidatus Methanomassiliicoccus intestinalis]|jgi:hypothetical protein|uniref:SHOCT domain-containing protein n=1 Tax=Candidatus Methanomassiliicoccus intestinalis TaxID=1406512 RepID=UPI002070F42B|nr:MAG TPA: Short C-terminal domain [Caudoviricetes sp.]
MGIFNRKPAVVITNAKREIKSDQTAASKRYIREYESSGNTSTILDFSPTKSYYPYLEIDDDHEYIKILNGGKGTDTYLAYTQITGCEICVDDVPGSNTGLLGAAAGGLLFGGTGAIVGGMAGKTNVEYVDSISVRIRTNSSTNTSVTVKTLKCRAKRGTSLVSKAIEDARAIEDLIAYAMNSKQNTAQSISTKTEEKDLSYIEELRKLKELVDEGILTQEEFETKKKRLLS